MAEQRKESIQCARFAVSDRILPPACLQESIHYVAVQAGDIDAFVAQPSTEIRDHRNMTFNGTRRVALLRYKARIRIQVFAERLLPEPVNRAGGSEELVYHSPSLPSGVQDYAT
ncbi:MAG: hypothetical protein H7039_06895 [Bryobacteraceae bacterium]|nr:hypothetical protein [Bryobacteraceae bacterium]